MNITLDELLPLITDSRLQEEIRGSAADRSDFTINFQMSETEGMVSVSFTCAISHADFDIPTTALASAIVVALRKNAVQVISSVTPFSCRYDLLGLTDGQYALLRPRQTALSQAKPTSTIRTKPRRTQTGKRTMHAQDEYGTEGSW